MAVQRVHSDTRTLQPGDLFVALKGERFDANDFLAEAQAQGRRRGDRASRPAARGLAAASRWTTASWRWASLAPAGARSSSCR